MAKTFFQFSGNKFYSSLKMEDAIPHRIRKVIGSTLNILIGVLLLCAFLTYTQHWLPETLPRVPLLPSFFIALAYILLAFRLPYFALDAFSNSLIADKKGEAPDINLAARFTFSAARFWYESAVKTGARSAGEFFQNLYKTRVGKTVMLRIGILEDDYRAFLETIFKSPENLTPLDDILARLAEKIPPDNDIAFADIMLALFDGSDAFQQFLVTKNIKRENLQRASAWIERKFVQADLRRRWWAQENLGRVAGLARGWAYGTTPTLEKYGIELGPEAQKHAAELVGREREISLVEAALLRQEGANVLLMGEAGGGKHSVLLGITHMIIEGTIFPELEHKVIWQLYPESIIASGKTKGAVEELLFSLLKETVRAGNIILAIDNFPEFVNSLGALGIDAIEIFAPFLESPAIHIIALAEPLSFRRVLEVNTGLMRFFQKIEITEPEEIQLINILEDLVWKMEQERGMRVVITFPAIEEVARGATQYIVTGAMPKRGVDLMEEACDDAVRTGQYLVTPTLVEELIERKTNIPLGAITEKEQEKLLHLEDFLHTRVVGQDEAVIAVSNAVRRARSEIRNPKRPIGTFLFLGPTGVGKTETAKALAENYFGNENTMVRFDMSEYQTEDALTRLVGSAERNEPGVLTSKMRQTPYCLLLLDEFEKTSFEIKNLFLQILDEGFFSDYSGERINMRNTIIIATSNAGAPMIWELIKTGGDPSQLHDQLINHIQREKILSPELLNRFDAIVVFKPLGKDSLRIIASLMLKKLVSRLKEQNITLSVADDLVDAVSEGGYNPEFGARPMQRFIQNRVEKIISDKILNKEIGPGSTITLSGKDLV